VAALSGGRAGADSPAPVVAWWYKAASSALPTQSPAPPHVPQGGLFVENDPSNLSAAPVPSGVVPPTVTGPTAFSTARIAALPGSSATLTLKVASGSTTQVADIAACPTSSPWQPPATEPGPYDKAPTYQCQASPPKGTVATDGSTIAWQLPPGY
jgi:hypothetical protein